MKRASMKGLKTNVKAGGMKPQHNQSRKLKLALSRETLKNLKTGVKAGDRPPTTSVHSCAFC